MLAFGTQGFGSIGPAELLGPARWPHFDLIWVFGGDVTFQIMNQHKLSLIEGSGLLIYPQTDFVAKTSSMNARVSVQHFTVNHDLGNLLLPLSRLRGRNCGVEVYQPPTAAYVEQYIARAIDPDSQIRTPMKDAAREALMVLLLAELAQWIVTAPVARVEHPELARLYTWFASKLGQKLSIVEMAEFVDMSPSRFRTVFSQHYGSPPGQYFNNMRIEEAARQLRETRRPVKQIAADIGEDDLPNFYRMFRICKGQSPATYRRKYATLA